MSGGKTGGSSGGGKSQRLFLSRGTEEGFIGDGKSRDERDGIPPVEEDFVRNLVRLQRKTDKLSRKTPAAAQKKVSFRSSSTVSIYPTS